jgi:hypothetical protein
MLSAYLDGELDTTTLHEVDLLLEKDEGARRYILDSVRTTALLRAKMNDILHEDIPQHLFDTLNPRQISKSHRKALIPSLIRVAAVLILGLLGFGTGMLMERNVGENFSAVITPLPAQYSNVVEAALENNLSGKPREWLAPRARVTVTPIKTYRNKSGVYYREYHLEVVTKTERSRINGLAYRTGKGQWKTSALFFLDRENAT